MTSLTAARTKARVPTWLLAAAMAGTVVALMYAGRGTGFLYDEWNFVIERHPGTLDSFLEPHNEHLSLLPVTVYKLLFATVGLTPHWPYLLALVLLHLVAAGLLFALVRRRVGDWAALVATVPVLLFGMAWENLTWAFQIGFVGSVAAALAALLALDRDDRRGDLLASVALAVSLASSSLGVPFLLGVAAELAWRRNWPRLAIVTAPPAALYALWYLAYGKSAITYDGVVRGLDWAIDAAAAAAGGLFGQGLDWGRPLALIGALALVWWLAGARPVSARLVAVLVAAGSFWLLTGFARSSPGGATAPPDSSRYVYVGVILILLVAAELLRGVRATPRALAVAGAVAVLSVLASVPTLRDGVQGRRTESDVVRAQLAAADLLGDHGAPEYRIDPQNVPPATIGNYQAAVGAIGDSPALQVSELPAASERGRGQADRVLSQAGGIGLGGGPAAALAPEPPAVDGSEGGRVSTRDGCVSFEGAGLIDLTVPPSGLSLRATETEAQVHVRRFSDQLHPTPLGVVQPGATTTLVPAEDASPVPWHVRLTSRSDVTACALQA